MEKGTIFQFSHDGRSSDIAVKEDEKDDVVRDLFWEISGRWTSSDIYVRFLEDHPIARLLGCPTVLKLSNYAVAQAWMFN